MKGYLRRKYTALFIALAMIMATLLPDTAMVTQAAGSAQKATATEGTSVQSSSSEADSVDAEILPAGADQEDASETSYTYREFSYTGQKIMPEVKIVDGGRQLIAGTDYKLSYKNNKDAFDLNKEYEGDFDPEKITPEEIKAKKIPHVMVKFKGNYSGTRYLCFSIKPIDVTDSDANLVAWTQTADAKAKVFVNGLALKNKTDYVVNGNKLVFGVENGAKKNNYTGELEKMVDATGKLSAKGNLTYNEESGWDFSGLTLTGTLTSTTDDNFNGAGPGSDYENYVAGKFAYVWGNGGVAQVKIKGEKLDKKAAPFSMLQKEYAYTGSEVEPLGEEGIHSFAENDARSAAGGAGYSEDYVLSYMNNVCPGSATAVVTGMNKYAGSTLKLKFKITAKADGGKFAIDGVDDEDKPIGEDGDGEFYSVYGGVKPNVGLKYVYGDGEEIQGLLPNVDYKMSYAYTDKNNVGSTITAKVKGQGAYKGLNQELTLGTVVASKNADKMVLYGPDTEMGKTPDVKKFKLFDVDGKALKNGTDFTVELADGEDMSKPGFKNAKATITNANYEEGSEVNGGFSLYSDKNNQVKKFLVKPNHKDELNGSGEFLTDAKGGVYFWGSPVVFGGVGNALSSALKVVTKGNKDGADVVVQEERDSDEDGIWIDPCSYVNNVKAGTAKCTIYGTGNLFGRATCSFKIVGAPRDGSSGLSEGNGEGFKSQNQTLPISTLSANVPSSVTITEATSSEETVAMVKIADNGVKLVVTSLKPGKSQIVAKFSDGASVSFFVTVDEMGAIAVGDITYYAPGEKPKEPVTLYEITGTDKTKISDYETIQPALTKLMADGSKGTFEIAIPEGEYEEMLFYNGSARLILSGQGRTTNRGEDVVIKFNNSGNSNKMKSYPDATYGVTNGYLRSVVRFNGSCDVALENLTIQNTYSRAQADGSNTQAEALLFSSTGNLGAYNCSFKSHQDTIQTHGKCWFYNCYVEGDVDFTWIEHSDNGSVALYERCELKAIGDENPQSRYAAPRLVGTTANIGKGEVFLNSEFTEDGILEGPDSNGTLKPRTINLARSVASGSDVDQAAFIKSTYTKVNTAITTPWGNDPHLLKDVPNFIIGWKMDQATATSIGYSSSKTGDARDILTEDEVAAEYSGRRAILNRVYNVAKNGFKKDSLSWFDVDALITARNWNVQQDTSTDVHEGETDETYVYSADKEITDYAADQIETEGFARVADKGDLWGATKGSTITLHVTDKCIVTVFGCNSAAGTIGMAAQNDDVYYHFNNGSTTAILEKAYVNYTGAGDIVIKADAGNYISQIVVDYDANLTEVPVTSVEVTAAKDKIKGKKNLQFTGKVTPSDASNKDIVWSLSENTLSGNGMMVETTDDIATIDPETGLLVAGDVTDVMTVTVLCTSRGADRIQGKYELVIEVAPKDEFTILWLDSADASKADGPANNSNEEIAEGKNLIVSSGKVGETSYGTWAYNSSKLTANPDCYGGLTFSTSAKMPNGEHGYDVCYIDFPITAGDKPVMINYIKAAFGNAGTDMPRAQYSYTVGSPDGDRNIVQQRTVEEETEGTEGYNKSKIRSSSEEWNVMIPIKPHETIYLRVAVGSTVCQIASGKSPTIGTVTISGLVAPVPGEEYYYNFSKTRDTDHAIVSPDLKTNPTAEFASDDGFFMIHPEPGYYHDDDHGYAVKTGSFFTAKVLPNSTVTLYGCQYGAGATVTVTAENDDTIHEVIGLPKGGNDTIGGTYNSSNPENAVSYTYEGEGKGIDTLIFTFESTGEGYLHSVKVEQGALKKFESQEKEMALTEFTHAVERETTIASATSDSESVVTAEVTNGSLILTSVTKGSANITVTMANGDVAIFKATVDALGAITASPMEYWANAPLEVTLSDLKAEATDKITSVTIADPKKMNAEISADNTVVTLTALAIGETGVTADLESGGQTSFTATVSAIGVITISDVVHTAASEVAEAPALVVDPESITTSKDSIGAQIDVTATVSDGGTLTYQWYEDKGDDDYLLTGATAARYLPSTETTGVFKYYVVVRNTRENGTFKETTSDIITVSIYDQFSLSVNDLGLSDIPDFISLSVNGVYADADDVKDVLTYSDNGESLSANWLFTIKSVPTGDTGTDELKFVFEKGEEVATATVKVVKGEMKVKVKPYSTGIKVGDTLTYDFTNGGAINNANEEEFTEYKLTMAGFGNTTKYHGTSYGLYTQTDVYSIDVPGSVDVTFFPTYKVKGKLTLSANDATVDTVEYDTGSNDVKIDRAGNGTNQDPLLTDENGYVYARTVSYTGGKAGTIKLAVEGTGTTYFWKIVVTVKSVEEPAEPVDWDADFLTISGGTAYSSDTKVTYTEDTYFDTALVLYSPSERLRIRKDTNYINYNGGTADPFAVTTIGQTFTDTLERYVAVDVSKLTAKGNVKVQFDVAIVSSDKSTGDTGELVLIDQDKKVLAVETGLKMKTGGDSREISAIVDASEVTKVTLGFSRGGAGGGGINVTAVSAHRPE